MAAKKAKPKFKPVSSEATQWGDLTREGQQGVARGMAETGKAPQRTRAEIDRLESQPSLSHKLDVNLRSLRLAAPGLRERTVTPSAAAGRRTALYDRAVGAAAPGHEPEGAGWYFHHRGTLNGLASRYGQDEHRVLTASAVMSPQNSPDNELAATSALLHAHDSGTVKMTKSLHQTLSDRGAVMDPAHVGKTVSFRDLHPSAVAEMSSKEVREGKHAPQTTADLYTIARGGTKGNISKAIRVLRGEVHPDDAINPQTAPKVWSYRHDIANAVPNSPQHVEYMSRVGSHASGNEALDLYGLRHSHEGILDPAGHTAEDTWMNSITSGQRLEGHATGRAGRASEISPAKTYGSGLGNLGAKTDTVTGRSLAAPAVTTQGLQHAYNNRATHLAAQRASRGTGFALPAVAMQEVSWTQARKEAGADTAHNEAQRAAAVPVKQEEVHGQLDIFGGVHRAKGQGRPRTPATGASAVVSQRQFNPFHDEPETPKERRASEAVTAQNMGRAWDRVKAIRAEPGFKPYPGWE